MGETMAEASMASTALEQDWTERILEDDEALRTVLSEAKRIAVIGIKDESRSFEPAHYIARYLKDAGYTVDGVNPGVSETLDLEIVDSIGDLEGPIDIVDIFRRSEAIPEHTREILAMPVLPKVVWLQLGIRHDEAARSLAEAGILVVQDRCILVEHRRLVDRRR